MRKLVIIVFLVVSGVVSAQSVTGTSGLIHIPSARMLEDGQLVLGAAYIPKPYFYRYEKGMNPGVNTYITYGILPFVEVMFRYTHELNLKVNPQTSYFPDRMFSLRVRLLGEKKHLPAIVFGAHDSSQLAGRITSTGPKYTAFYLVSSKMFKSSFGDFDVSVGYAFDFLDIKTESYKGLFSGITYTPFFLKNLSIKFENDSRGFNSGVVLNVFNKINFMLGVWNLDKPTFSFNYLF